MSKYSDLIDEVYGDSSAETPIKSKYSDLIDKEYGTDNQTTAMRASVFSSAPINPDQAAQQYQISKQVNLPVNIVRAKENEIKQMTELNSIDYDAIAKNFPTVATQLADPNKSGAIRDDVDKLSYFERVVANTGQEFRNQEAGAQSTDLRLKKMAALASGKKELSPQEENTLALYYQNLEGTDYKLDRFTNPVVALAAKIPQYTIGQIPTLVDVAKTALPAAVGGAFIGGVPAATSAAGLSLFARSAKRMTVDAFDEYSKFVDEKGQPIEPSVAAGAAVLTGGVGGSLELLSGKVLLSPFKKLFTKESAQKLLQTSAGREALKNIAKGAFAEGSTEVAQEYVQIGLGEAAKVASSKEFTPFYTPIPEEAELQTLEFKGTENLTRQEQEQYKTLQDKISEAKKAPLSLDKVASFFASEEVSKRAKESFIGGAIGGGGFSTVGAGMTYAANLYDKREQSKAEKEQIKETTQNVKESKTFNRSQELFKDVTEETLGQQNVYIPAEKVQTYFQDKTPQEVEEFYKQVPEAREQLQDALESGGNLILKGNNAYAAFAQDAYAPLQDFASLSPENITDEAYQDAFLQDVVSNVNYDEKVKKVRTEQDIVNKNIETQIQNLGIPYRDAKDLITLTKAFYETNLKKYGNEQATKLLNNYFKNLQIKNEVYVDDVAEILKKARAPQKALPKAGKPLLKFLKEKGGVKLGSNLAGELNALGITPKTAPALFKKTGGIGDVDNFPASEFAERFPNINAKVEGDYVDRQALLDLIAEEARGTDISRQISEEQRLVEDFIRQLDELGLDLNAPDEEIKKAIDEYRKGGYEQNYQKIFQERVKGAQNLSDELGKKLKINSDGSITVYHGTSKQNAKKILDDGIFNDSTYFSIKKSGTEFGDSPVDVARRKFGKDAIVMEVKVDARFLESAAAGSELFSPSKLIRGEDGVFTAQQTYFQTQDQTKTPAFKKWFGDSKVVDENGEPLVVYHGSNAKFDTFDTKKIGQTATAEGYGFYLSDNKEIAKGYQRDGGSLIEAYLSMQKPLDSKRKPFNVKEISQVINKIVDIEIKKFGDEITDYKDSFLSNFVDTYSLSKAQSIKETAQLIVEGNDTAIDQISELSNVVGDKTTVPAAIRDTLGFDGVEVKDFQQGEGTVYLAWFPTQIKSVENKGTFDPENANIYFQNQTPTFYSALEKQITDLPQGKGSPEQWAGIIKNLTQKGVKQEELDWTGIEDWIKEQKGSVTKEQILNYLNANKIEVEEVVKGETSEPELEQISDTEWNLSGYRIEEITEPKEDLNDILREDGYFIYYPEGDYFTHENSLQSAKEFILDRLENQDGILGDTKFSKYTLAGGENYRELLLTLPKENKQLADIRKRFTDLAEKRDEKSLTPDEQKEYDELLKKLEGKKNPNFSKDSSYKSSHYDEPNILAHIRFNERADKDGNKVMFIEELQSDWHQEGRKKGYKKIEPAFKIKLDENELRHSYKTKEAADTAVERLKNTNPDGNYSVFEDKIEISGVPDAPFKTTWSELAFKRALLWAVENGFDKVAWTTGEQQAERYDLSKQVDEIAWERNKDGTYGISVFKDKELISEFENKTPAQLEEIIGKEPTQKIVNNEGEKLNNKIVGSLEGDNLKVGGEGMKAFYDKIVPTMANKLVKKFGGKVETTKIEDVGEVWSLEITPAMRESIQKQGLPLFQKSTTAPRGQFKYLQGKPIISLFQDKNKSTLLHELGHTFLEIQKELSKIPEISEEATKDWKVLEDWLDIKDGNITVEAHEKFARGFEAYLREGKAPSVELRTAFARFFTWLTRIYKDVLQLNVKLNNEVREVFDRMLATQEAIDAQKNNPLFRVDDQVLELLNAKEKEDYLKISENAGLKARETLTKKALRQKEKENTKFYKQQRAVVKKQIRQAMEESPTYRALNFFKTGELYGAEEQVEAYKLNEEEAQFNYPDLYKKLKNKGIFEKDGVSLDIAAEDFGFKDGGVMLNSLSSAKPFNNELRRATDEEMIRRFGDMLYDGTIEDEAKDAMQNEARANKILYELNGINRKVKSYVENKEAYKQKAQEIFAKKPLSVATDSNQFYIAEVKAAREAGKALGKKDFEKAITEKKKQLLNHYLYRESLQLKKELQTAYKKYAKYKKRPAQGKVVLEEEYREKIVELLANFGLAKMPEGVEFSVADLEAWKKEQTDLGILGLVEFPEVEEFANKPFKQLTADEFRTLNDAVENLAFVGEAQRFIEVEGKRIELKGLSDSIIEQLKDIETRKQSIGRPSKTEEAKELFDAYMATIIKAKEIAIDVDGGKFGGKFYNSFIEPLASGELKRNEMIKEATKKFLDLRKQYLKSVKLNKKTYFELIDKSLDKEAAISIALNWGNEKNRKRIRDGYGWNDSQINEIISSLTENEWKYVEEIWKFINSYQKDAYAVQKKLIGFTPRIEKASPFSVKTSDGVTIQLQGGYYPIMYVDKTKLGAQIKEQINSPVGSNLPLYKSYTKERSEGKVDKQVNLTLLPAVKHIADVINDIALKEAACSSNRLLNYAPLRKVLKEKIGDIPVETLQVWLGDMFGVTSSYAGIVERILDHIRVGTTISALGASIATTIIQIPGFVQAIPDIGYLNTIKGIYKFIGNANPSDINANRKKALEKSKILQSRAETFNQAIYDVLKDMAGKGAISRNAIPFFFYPMQVAQSIPDTIVWYGAYSKGLKDFNGDDAKAVKYADYIVVKTQGSGLTQDLSAIERGSLGNVRRSKLIKLFTAFGTYFVAKFNVARRSFKDTNFKNPVNIAKFMSDMIALYLIEAIAGEIILNRIPDFDDDDEDAYAGYVFKTMMQTFASQFFLGREAVGLSKGYDGTPSGFGGLKKAYQGGEDVFEQTINAFTDEDVEMTKIIKGANKSASVIMHFPSTPIDTLVSAYEKEQEGEDVALIDYFIKPRKK